MVFFAQVTVKSGIRGYNAELAGNRDAIDNSNISRAIFGLKLKEKSLSVGISTT